MIKHLDLRGPNTFFFLISNPSKNTPKKEPSKSFPSYIFLRLGAPQPPQPCTKLRHCSTVTCFSFLIKHQWAEKPMWVSMLFFNQRNENNAFESEKYLCIQQSIVLFVLAREAIATCKEVIFHMKEYGVITTYGKDPDNIASSNGEELGQEDDWLCHRKSGSVRSETMLEVCVSDLVHWCTYIYRQICHF